MLSLDLPEPTPSDLAAIEDEWPIVEAGLAVLNAQIAMIYAEDRGGPTPLDWRRLRRAEQRLLRAALDHVSDPAPLAQAA
ncbi:MAG TPA: DUF6284 family protein [Micromonosporaceae bacterium]|nr:DUF6284 family protein [Micromonosporaceae bacterium]